MLAVALSFGRAATAHAQGSITGRVTEQGTGQPVEGARVLLVGGGAMSTTGADGRYTLRGVPAGSQTVQALRIGYVEQKKPVTIVSRQESTVDFVLVTAAVQLTEVVTTATGETRRVELGNSIPQIDAARLMRDQPIATVGDLLTARTPGVMALPSNMTGTGTRIRVRGTNSLSLSNNPIYIIDGVRMTSTASASTMSVGGSQPSRLNDLNPADVDNIEVVKGPSAATLYGTDAANGVIVITTKRGRAGSTRWTASVEQGLIQQRNDFPTAFSGWGQSATGVTQVCNLARQVAGTCTLDSISSFNLFKDPSTRPFGNGNREKYGLQLSGGTESLRYFTSLDYEEEVGAVKMPEADIDFARAHDQLVRPEWVHPNMLSRVSSRLNVNATVTPKLDIALSSGFIQLDQRLPNTDNNTFGLFSHAYGGAGYKYQISPGDTTFGGRPKMGYRALTPGEIFRATTREDVNRFIGSLNASWRPLAWMSNRATVGVDYSAQEDDNICRLNECPGSATRILGSVNNNRVSFYNYTVDLASSANFQPLAWLNSKTTAGLQYVNTRTDQNSAGGTTLPPGAQTVSAAAVATSGEATGLSKTLGLFVEETGGIRDRLFLTAALRTDQNSAFGTDFQRVFYPKLSASYIISDEDYFPKPAWLDRLRLRSSFGSAGVQPNSNDALRFFVSSSPNVDRVDRAGLVQSSLGNSKLKPERSTEFESGFEATLFGNRSHIDFTYYNKQSHDALISRVLAPSGGAAPRTARQNIGSMKNVGFEGVITSQLLDRRTFGWDVALSGTTNSNKLVSLGDVPPQIGVTISQIAGYPVNGWWDRKYTFRDVNNDGIISASELTVDADSSFLGYSTPRYELVVTNGFDLFDKKLRVQSLVDYKGGYKIENVTEEFRCSTRNNCQALYDKNVPLEDQARVAAMNGLSRATFYGFIEDGSFIRFRELSLTYAAPEAFAGRYLRAHSASLSFAARNLGFFMKKYSGIDPEMNYFGPGAAGNDVQNEFQTSPTPTYFTLRLTVGF